MLISFIHFQVGEGGGCCQKKIRVINQTFFEERPSFDEAYLFDKDQTQELNMLSTLIVRHPPTVVINLT